MGLEEAILEEPVVIPAAVRCPVFFGIFFFHLPVCPVTFLPGQEPAWKLASPHRKFACFWPKSKGITITLYLFVHM